MKFLKNLVPWYSVKDNSYFQVRRDLDCKVSIGVRLNLTVISEITNDLSEFLLESKVA